MIIRVGDEKRVKIDEHLCKLKDQLLSHEAQKHHRQLIIESFLAASMNLPHKAFVYGGLLALLAMDS